MSCDSLFITSILLSCIYVPIGAPLLLFFSQVSIYCLKLEYVHMKPKF